MIRKQNAKEEKPETGAQIGQFKSLKNNNPPSEKEKQNMDKEFPIVGIGASAGGLEALELFLSHVPENSGMAFVIVQHLDPTHKGIMPELLQRITKNQVVQVHDRLKVKPGFVYVIPPNRNMSILNGALYLFEPVEKHGLRLPIDFFFRSLADDRQEKAIGVILSGMGSDGSLGLRAIKEKAGVTLVQDPSSAKFDGMPKSAIEAGLADIVANAEELPEKIISYLQNVSKYKFREVIDSKVQSSLEKIVILLRTQNGHDFSNYKKNTLYRRIERRMGIHQIDKISSYVRFLQENSNELDLLFKELLIGVTNFFRDAAVWEYLKENVLPSLIDKLPNGYVLRAWVPGCSTGEEAYSLAIVFKETMGKVKPARNISFIIFATDLDNEAIEKARKGLFPSNIQADVSLDRLNRFFVKTNEGYRIKSEIREMVVFATQNLIKDPPFTRLDIITCRNLLIYMEAGLQKKVLEMFHYSLNLGGLMLLGNSESIGDKAGLFTPLEQKMRLFKRFGDSVLHENNDFPLMFSRDKPALDDEHVPEKPVKNIQILADQLLLQQFSPSGVLVNETGDILYISSRTGKYLEPPVGKVNWNILAMLRDGLRADFPSAFRRAIQQKTTLTLSKIKVGTDGGTQTIDVDIHWIENPEALKGSVMVVFRDVPEVAHKKSPNKKGGMTADNARIAELELELQKSLENLQSIHEEMQTSQEELKSANEELQSTNEELQSTNEELTTSKEEMQSMNEELQTVNSELQVKVDDLTKVRNDMNNLLNSTEIATLFLDKDLRIRQFTTQAVRIIKLIQTDIGRPFTDLVSSLVYPEFSSDSKEVLRTLIPMEKTIPATDGRFFTIRILPYRTTEDSIEGLVITFIDITRTKSMENQLKQAGMVLRSLIDSLPSISFCLSSDGIILEFNREAEKVLGRKRGEVLGQSFFRLFVPESVRSKAEMDMVKLLDGELPARFQTQARSVKGDISLIEFSAHKILDEKGGVSGIIAIGQKGG
jgi:two-component system, chemotaxis family, CheB/CheR fusion protein